jgi:hypothetical protein
MLTGNTMPGISVVDYGDATEAINVMRGFVRRQSGN